MEKEQSSYHSFISLLAVLAMAVLIFFGVARRELATIGVGSTARLVERTQSATSAPVVRELPPAPELSSHAYVVRLLGEHKLGQKRTGLDKHELRGNHQKFSELLRVDFLKRLHMTDIIIHYLAERDLGNSNFLLLNEVQK